MALDVNKNPPHTFLAHFAKGNQCELKNCIKIGKKIIKAQIF
jgi:hypothetical protein